VRMCGGGDSYKIVHMNKGKYYKEYFLPSSTLNDMFTHFYTLIKLCHFTARSV
jgi:hypothetical protein